MVYIFLALIFFTIVILTNTVAARHAHPAVVAAIVSVVGGIGPLLLIIASSAKQSFQSQKFGIIMSLFCGVAAGIYIMALSKSFSENKVALVVPIVYGGTILLSSVLSYFIFKEKISLIEGIGLLLVLAGLAIILYARAAAV